MIIKTPTALDIELTGEEMLILDKAKNILVDIENAFIKNNKNFIVATEGSYTFTITLSDVQLTRDVVSTFVGSDNNTLTLIE